MDLVMCVRRRDFLVKNQFWSDPFEYGGVLAGVLDAYWFSCQNFNVNLENFSVFENFGYYYNLSQLKSLEARVLTWLF